jgi:hypothetical protein
MNKPDAEKTAPEILKSDHSSVGGNGEITRDDSNIIMITTNSNANA